MAQKIDEELLFAADTIVAPVRPEASQKRVSRQPGNQVFGDGCDRVITTQASVEGLYFAHGSILSVSKSRTRRAETTLMHWARCYFPVNSFITALLTTLPSTRAPAKRAMTFFITAPMSFIVGEPISAMVALTAAMISSSATAFGM